jgi:hypothetical protein
MNSYFGVANEKFALSNVKCKGNEENIGQCMLTHHNDCGPGEVAGVVCQNTTFGFHHQSHYPAAFTKSTTASPTKTTTPGKPKSKSFLSWVLSSTD